MNHNQNSNLLIDLWRATNRRRFFVIVFIGMYLGIVLGIAIVIPKKYESSGKLFVRLGRGGVTLDPTVTTSQTILIQESRESEINSIVDVLQSRDTLERVVNHPNLGPERILATESLLQHVKIPRLSTWLPNAKNKVDEDDTLDYDRLMLVNDAVERLYDNLSVKAPRKAANISISCRSESPKLSQEIVATLMEVYLDRHVEARKTDGSFDFFQQQYDQLTTVIEERSEKLAELKNELGIMSVDETQSALRHHISELERDLVVARGKAEAATSRIETTQQLVTTIPENVEMETTTGVANQANDLMRDRLYQLELEERDLANRYAADHPLLVSIRKKVAEAKQVIDGVAEHRTEVRAVVNENLISLRLNLLNAETDKAVAEAEIKHFETCLATAEEKLRKLNSRDVELQRLERELTEARQSQEVYAEKLEEARINVELDKERISNVAIIQPASLQVQHVSPSYKLVLVGGLLSAIVAAVAAAYLLESLRRSRTEEPMSLDSQPDGPHQIFSVPKSRSVEGERRVAVSEEIASLQQVGESE